MLAKKAVQRKAGQECWRKRLYRGKPGRNAGEKGCTEESRTGVLAKKAVQRKAGQVCQIEKEQTVESRDEH